jgi:hypothetical protein
MNTKNWSDSDDSFEKGRQFENYVRNCLFPEKNFELLKYPGYYRNESCKFDPSCQDPDFMFRDRKTNKVFYVEAKFRKYYYGDIVWTYREQLSRYQAIGREIPTFIILGLGDRPMYPILLTLIPIAEAKYVAFFRRYIMNFVIPLNQDISANTLWQLERGGDRW